MDQRSLYLMRQALTALFKRWRMVAVVFLVLFVPFNFTNLLKEPVYQATSKLLITRERVYPEVSPLQRSAAVEKLPNESSVNSEIQLLRSRDLMLRLHEELQAQRADEPGRDSVVPTVKTLEGKVRVTRKPGSNVLEVTYRSTNPDRAINVVNTLVDLYVDYHIDMHKAPGALGFFERETQAAKEGFIHADLELERFDATHGLTSITTEKENLLRQRAQLEADLRRTEARVTELTTKVAAIEAELEYIPEQEATEVEMVPNPLLGYLRQNLARLEMERERLLQLYTPQHRLVMDVESEVAGIKRQIAAQEASVVGRKRMAQTPVRRTLEEDLLSSQAELGALEARRSLLAERISDYEAKIRVMHAKHYEVMRLRRDRTEKKASYETLRQKLDQLKVSEAMDLAGLSNVSVIEAAMPPLRRDADYKAVTLTLTAIMALLISVSSAVATEMLNPVMNSELDVRHNLGLPVLAEIPLTGYGYGPGDNNQQQQYQQYQQYQQFQQFSQFAQNQNNNFFRNVLGRGPRNRNRNNRNSPGNNGNWPGNNNGPGNNGPFNSPPRGRRRRRRGGDNNGGNANG